MCHKTEEVELCCNSQLECSLLVPHCLLFKVQTPLFRIDYGNFWKISLHKTGEGGRERGKYYQYRVFSFLPSVSIII